MKDYFAVRTRYFDDYLLKAAQAGCRQVVILAAGLDARAFRLNWPASTRVFEIDLPEVLEFKDEVVVQVGLKPLCERHVVPADLRGRWAAALTVAGLVRDQKSVWLAEGIFMYLSREEGDSLVKSISRLAEKESQLALEHVRRKPKKTLAFSTALFLLARLGSPWRSGVDDPVAWLARFGWTAKAHDPVKVASFYGRTMPGPAQGWLVEGLRTAE